MCTNQESLLVVRCEKHSVTALYQSSSKQTSAGDNPDTASRLPAAACKKGQLRSTQPFVQKLHHLVGILFRPSSQHLILTSSLIHLAITRSALSSRERRERAGAHNRYALTGIDSAISALDQDDRQVINQIITRDPPLPHGLGEQQRGFSLRLPSKRCIRKRLRGTDAGQESYEGLPRRGGILVVLVSACSDVR